MQIFLLQHNPIPGDFKYNINQLIELTNIAKQKADQLGKILCITPLYAIAGRPWLNIRKHLKYVGGFYGRCRNAAEEMAEAIKDGPDMLISLTGADVPLYALLRQGKILPLSPNKRGVLTIPDGPIFYIPARDPSWALQEMTSNFDKKPSNPIDAILFTAGEPFQADDQETRESQFASIAGIWKTPVLSIQHCGGVDSLVYTGQSTVFSNSGKLIARAPAFERGIISLSLQRDQITPSVYTPDGIQLETIQPNPEGAEALLKASVMGLRDFINKNNIGGVIIGLSGGMDSALVACLAVEALGAERVLGVMMPSRFSSTHSVQDAEELSKNLGIKTRKIVVTPMMDAYAVAMNPAFEGLTNRPNDLTEENLQPRIRGAILMALSNKTGWVVLGTGNKSENAVGYCTLYGDTVGAIEPLGDMYKTETYEVARKYNEIKGKEIIPENIFLKAPSAELHPNQKDEDSLPPYPILDQILKEIIENGANPKTLTLPGVDKKVIQDTVKKLATSEYKRHQSPPPIKLSRCAFGLEWHFPVVARALDVS